MKKTISHWRDFRIFQSACFHLTSLGKHRDFDTKKNHENNYREYTIEDFMNLSDIIFTKVWDSRSNRYKRWNSPPLKSIPFYYMKKLMN